MDPKLFPEGQCRLILIGKTGNGKSATGNTILGFKAFESQVGINSKTKVGDLKSADCDHVELQVMDTPGLQDTEISDEKMGKRITRSLLAVSPGPHAVILCLSAEQRFTPQEMKVVETLKELFGEKLMSYLIVVLVRRDALERAGVRFEDELKDCTLMLELMAEINNRYVLFDNRPELSPEKKRRQVQQLLQYVMAVVEQNGDGCFRHRLSIDMDRAMDVLKKAEQKKLEQDPSITSSHEAYREAPDKPKPPPKSPRLAKVRESEEVSKPMEDTLFRLREAKTVTENLRQFEARISQELTSEEEASNFTLKANGGKTSTAEDNSRQDQEGESPPKPHRIHPGEKEVETVSAGIQRLPFHPQDSSNQGVKSRSVPSKSFTYKVPDKPGMGMKEKQMLVEEALKRNLAQGKDLSEEQTEELEKASRSLGQKLREGMAKYKAQALDMCRLM